MMPGVQKIKQCRTLDQNKHTRVRCLINSILSHFHAFCIDKGMFCLRMAPVSLDSKKIFMFESIKIGQESIKLIVKTSKFVQG